MCTSPKKITNRTKVFTEGTRHTVNVPCGHCEECREQKAEGYYQRIMMEVADCHSHGGKVIFATFTYNDSHLPRFHYYDEAEDRCRSFPCFSKADKDKFNHDIIQYFSRHFGLSNANFEYPLKSFWACEFGTTEGKTHRPHYHALYFIPKEYLDAFGRHEGKWKMLFKKYWEFFPYNRGFVRFSPGNSIFVNSDFVGLYTSKYVCKDLEFYQNPEVSAYTSGMTRSKSDEKYQAVKSFLPTHWQSLHFGEGLCHFYRDKEAFVHGLDFSKIVPLKSELDSGKKKLHHVPRYIERKLCYEKDIFGREVLSLEGKVLKGASLESNVKDIAKKYLDCIEVSDIEYRLKDCNWSKNSVLVQFKSIEDISKFLKHIVHSEEIAVEMAYYNRVWSGYNSFGNTNFVKTKLSLASANHSDFCKLSLEQYLLQINSNVEDSGCFIYREDGVFFDKDIVNHFQDVTWIDELPRFLDFQVALDIISEINFIYANRKHSNYIKKRKEAKLLKYIDSRKNLIA